MVQFKPGLLISSPKTKVKNKPNARGHVLTPESEPRQHWCNNNPLTLYERLLFP